MALMGRLSRCAVAALASVTVVSLGVSSGGQAFAAAPSAPPSDLFSDAGANKPVASHTDAPASVVAEAKARAWSPKHVNRTVVGGPAKGKWRMQQSPNGAKGAALASPAAVSSVDANVAAPGLGVQKFYGMQEFPIRDGLSMAVNLGNGNLVIEGQDQKFNAPGVASNWGRFYNSLSKRTGAYGSKWSLTGGQDVGLELSSTQVVFRGLSGFRASFTGSGTSWTAPSGLGAKLTANSDKTWKVVVQKSHQTYNFDANGFLTSVKDRNGVGLSYTYQTVAGQQVVASVQDAAGRVSTFGYDTSGRITSITDPSTRVTKYAYDSSGNLVSSTDADKNTTTYTWSSGQITKIVTARGVTVQMAYDSTGRVTSVTTYPQVNAGGTAQVTKFSYSSGSTVATNPLGKATTSTIDSSGRVTASKDPDGVVHSTTYNANSDTTQTWAITGQVTSFSYDTNNNPTQVKMPTGATSSATYVAGACGAGSSATGPGDEPTCVTDDAGNKTTIGYDANGNMTSQQDTTKSGGRKISKSWSIAGSTDSKTNCSPIPGQLCQTTDGNGNTRSYYYNSQGDLLQINSPQPLGSVTYAYDELGRVTAAKLGRGQSMTYTWDDMDHIVAMHVGNIGSTPAFDRYYTYDADGNLTNVDNSTFAYDGQNRQVSMTNPAKQASSLTYDAAGNITKLTAGDGSVSSYTYDPANRILTAVFAGGSCTATGQPGCIKFAYDTAGREKTRTFPGGLVQTTTVDASNRVTEISDANGATKYFDNTYSYTNGSSDRSLLQSSTQVLKFRDFPAPAGAKTTYSYDSLNRLTKAVEMNGTTQNAAWSYAYDNNGNRTSTSATGNTYAYTDYNNKSHTVTYNGADEIATVDGTATGTSFDADGNETSAVNQGYGVQNRTADTTSADQDITSMTGPDGSVFNYASAQTLPTGPRQMTNQHGYAFNYALLGLQNFDSPYDTGTAKVFNLPNGEHVGYQNAAGSREYLLKDNQGSTVRISEDDGTANSAYSYDPYGQFRDYYRNTTGASDNVFMYTGGIRDRATGLYRLGARWYDPTQGRFTQPDPSGQEQNSYLYASGDPINKEDPTGLDGVEDILGGAIAIGGALALVPAAAASAPVAVGMFILGAGGGGLTGYGIGKCIIGECSQ